MAEILSESRLETFNSYAIQEMDGTVAEVFGMMLGMDATAVTACQIPDGKDVISAIVGFAGVMTGCCILQMHSPTALKVTSAMMGSEVTEVDGSVKDAIGELCNMVAGGWKNKLPGVAAECLLSVPTVVSGEQYEVHYSPNTLRRVRSYAFDGMCMNVIMLCELRG